MRILFTVGVSVVLMLSAAIFLSGRNIELLAKTSTPILAEATINPAAVDTITTLNVGERVDVLSCQDLKHYSVPEVRLPDGRTGFIGGGQYELTKSFPSFSFDKPIVFSCP